MKKKKKKKKGKQKRSIEKTKLKKTPQGPPFRAVTPSKSSLKRVSDGGIFEKKFAKTGRERCTQYFQSTRIVMYAHDPAAQPSRIQGFQPRAW